MTTTRSLVAALFLVGGCGATPRTEAAPTPRGASEGVLCAPPNAPFRYRFFDLPPEVAVRTLDAETCLLVPEGDPPFAWMVTVGTERLGDPEARLLETSDPLIGSGDLEFLGRRAPYEVHARGAVLVGEGETLSTQLALTRWLVGSMVVTSPRAPADLRDRAIDWLGHLRIEAVHTEFDALPYDPSRPSCVAGDLPLLLSIPEGGTLDRDGGAPSCVVHSGAELETADWSIEVTTLPLDESVRSYASSTDGARRWFEASTPNLVAGEEGELAWLGSASRFFAFETTAADGSSWSIAVTWVVERDRIVVAVVMRRPSAAASLPTLLEVLRGAARLAPSDA